MKGGLTPVGQPLDKVNNKVFKGYLCDIYHIQELTYPINTATGSPHQPTWKKCVTWVVEAWEKVLEEISAKAWTACGHRWELPVGNYHGIRGNYHYPFFG